MAQMLGTEYEILETQSCQLRLSPATDASGKSKAVLLCVVGIVLLE